MTKYHDEEKNLLKITINHLVKENDELKQQIEDMKITLQSNKDLLKEYLSQISNKDSTVQKLNNTIEQLKIRLQNLQSPMKPPNDIHNKHKHFNQNQDINPINNPNQLPVLAGPLTTRKKRPRLIKNIALINNIDEDYNNYCEKQKIVLAELSELKSSLIALMNQKEKEEEMHKENNQIKEVNDLNQLLQYEQDDGSQIVLFVAENNQIWELIPKPELTEEALNNVNTINELAVANNDNDNDNSISSDIEINYDEQENISLLDIDFNISKGSAFSYNSHCLESLK